MRPDQCGFGRRIADLPDGDRQVVEEFAAFLRGELDYDPKTCGFVAAGEGCEPGPVEGSEGCPMTTTAWSCPIPTHRAVGWDGEVACCLFPGCLRRSDYERNSCECEIYDCWGGCCGGQCSCAIEAARRCPDFPECREERYVSDLLASVKAGEPVGKWVSGCVECDRLAEEVGR